MRSHQVRQRKVLPLFCPNPTDHLPPSPCPYLRRGLIPMDHSHRLRFLFAVILPPRPVMGSPTRSSYLHYQGLLRRSSLPLLLPTLRRLRQRNLRRYTTHHTRSQRLMFVFETRVIAEMHQLLLRLSVVFVKQLPLHLLANITWLSKRCIIRVVQGNHFTCSWRPIMLC
jgi:hypothetical protein